MSDLISRQDAIALVNRAIHGTDNKEIQDYLFGGLRKDMWSLPSATCDDCIWHVCNYNKVEWDAEPKTGEWVQGKYNWEWIEGTDSNLISRSDALKPFCIAPDGTRIPEVDCDNFPVEFSIEFIKKHLLSLPSAGSCKGCKHRGQWENEYEMGYPSPCKGCRRRAKDNYER